MLRPSRVHQNILRSSEIQQEMTSQLVYGRQISTSSDRQFNIISTNQSLIDHETKESSRDPTSASTTRKRHDSCWRHHCVKEWFRSTNVLKIGKSERAYRKQRWCNSGRKGLCVELWRCESDGITANNSIFSSPRAEMSPDTESLVPRAGESVHDEDNETRKRPRRTASADGELVRKGLKCNICSFLNTSMISAGEINLFAGFCKLLHKLIC